jgi:hypothetical protein
MRPGLRPTSLQSSGETSCRLPANAVDLADIVGRIPSSSRALLLARLACALRLAPCASGRCRAQDVRKLGTLLTRRAHSPQHQHLSTTSAHLPLLAPHAPHRHRDTRAASVQNGNSHPPAPAFPPGRSPRRRLHSEKKNCSIIFRSKIYISFIGEQEAYCAPVVLAVRTPHYTCTLARTVQLAACPCPGREGKMKCARSQNASVKTAKKWKAREPAVRPRVWCVPRPTAYRTAVRSPPFKCESKPCPVPTPCPAPTCCP